MLWPLPGYADGAAPWVGNDLNGIHCDGGGQGVGPFDYTFLSAKSPAQLQIVEEHHFTPEVEALIRGKSSRLEDDLNYTLRAWPNHHRALLSIIKYQLNIKNKLMPGALKVPPECYLQRAIHFSPKDAVSYSLFGHYMRKIGYLEDAVKYYEKALALDSKNAKFAYSFSLLLIDLKRYDEAAKYAKIAYRNPNTPQGLKQQLKKLGMSDFEMSADSVD